MTIPFHHHVGQQFRRSPGRPEGVLVGLPGSGKSALLRQLFSDSPVPGRIASSNGQLVVVQGSPYNNTEDWMAKLADLTEPLVPVEPNDILASNRLDQVERRLGEQHRTISLAFDGFEAAWAGELLEQTVYAWLLMYENHRLRRPHLRLTIALQSDTFAAAAKRLLQPGGDFAKVVNNASHITWSGQDLLQVVARRLIAEGVAAAQQTKQSLERRSVTTKQVSMLVKRATGRAVPAATLRWLDRVARNNVASTPGEVYGKLGMTV